MKKIFSERNFNIYRTLGGGWDISHMEAKMCGNGHTLGAAVTNIKSLLPIALKIELNVVISHYKKSIEPKKKRSKK